MKHLRKDWPSASPQRIQLANRKARLKKHYGITPEQYEQMALDGCMVCGVTQEPDGRRLHVDHCHSTGVVRGVLCGKCNRALGLLNDNPTLIQNLLDYATRKPSHSGT